MRIGRRRSISGSLEWPAARVNASDLDLIATLLEAFYRQLTVLDCALRPPAVGVEDTAVLKQPVKVKVRERQQATKQKLGWRGPKRRSASYRDPQLLNACPTVGHTQVCDKPEGMPLWVMLQG